MRDVIYTNYLFHQYFNRKLIWRLLLIPKYKQLAPKLDWQDMSLDVTKCTVVHVRPAKIQISLRIRAAWSESSLGAFWIAKGAMCLHAGNEDWSDCADAQADLSHRWSHMSEGTFSNIAAHIGWDLLFCFINDCVRNSEGCSKPDFKITSTGFAHGKWGKRFQLVFWSIKQLKWEWILK